MGFLALNDLTEWTQRREEALTGIRQAISALPASQPNGPVPSAATVMSEWSAATPDSGANASDDPAEPVYKFAVTAVDRSQLMILYPVCHMEQRSNHNICFRCGIKFVDAAEV
jgi:hypothetical protein